MASVNASTTAPVPSQRPLRILYAAGPGDVVGTFRHWKAGRDDPSQVAVTYSGQFYDLCREIGARACVISHCPRRDREADAQFRTENRPVPFIHAPGVLYLLGQTWYGLRLTASAIRFRADVVVAMSGMTWFSLALLPLLGTRVVPTLHAQLWRLSHPPRGINRLLWWLNGVFFRRMASAVIYISDSVLHELQQLVGSTPIPVLCFVPTYREGSFASGQEAEPPDPPPFRVMFAGRVEPDKGVFHLLDVARRIAAEGRTEIEFDLCGSGSAMDELCRRAEAAGLSPRFRCHGHMNKPAMKQMYRQAHITVVPTTTDSQEGLNKVIIESVLATRPVITSPMCPAIEYVRSACVEVAPDDIKGYGDAILRLEQDRAFYEQKRTNCQSAGNQFYDPTKSWGATFKRVLEVIGLLPAAGPHAATTSPSAAREPASAR